MMESRAMKIHATNQIPWGERVEIRMGRYGDQSHELYVAKPVVFERVEPGAHVDPALVLHTDDAQLLMDELWRIGLRPSEGSGSAGSLAATERHLGDMRAIAFKQLGMPAAEEKPTRKW